MRSRRTSSSGSGELRARSSPTRSPSRAARRRRRKTKRSSARTRATASPVTRYTSSKRASATRSSRSHPTPPQARRAAATEWVRILRTHSVAAALRACGGVGCEREERVALARFELVYRVTGDAVARVRAEERFVFLRRRRAAREGDRVGELLARLRPDPLELVRRERIAEQALHPHDGIRGGHDIRDLALLPVALRVADVVSARAIGLALDERRPAAGYGMPSAIVDGFDAFAVYDAVGAHGD